ncbi:MAG: YceI family protein [Planctomycetota bacterium]
MKRILQWIGAAAWLALSVGSLAALFVVRERVRIVVEQPGSRTEQEPNDLALLRADIEQAQVDLAAIAEGLAQHVELVRDELDAASESRARSLHDALRTADANVTALRDELARAAPLPPTTQASALAVSTPAASPTDLSPPVPASDTAPSVATTATAAPRRFLSFQLPHTSFSFEGPQRLALVPTLSRVGFDARSTLHDFSGVTQRIEGELVVDLAHPERGCAGTIHVGAATLDTGSAGRDEEMRTRLDAVAHPLLTFDWRRFEPSAIDVAAQTLSGIAHGELTIRGATRACSMPVTVAVDASKRVTMRGETQVSLRTYGIEPPSQLGVISVEDEVRIWIALTARSLGRTQPEDAHAH